MLKEFLENNNVVEFEDYIRKILDEKKNSILESSDFDLEEFMDSIGVDDYEEFGDHVSIIFSEKSDLDEVLELIEDDDDIDYDVFFYNPDEQETDNIDDTEYNVDDVIGDYVYELVIYKDSDEDFDDSEEMKITSESEESIIESNETEGGRAIKRRVSYAKKRRGGKLINKRNKRRKGKISRGAGKGYKTRGVGWKVKMKRAARKRKITKTRNVSAQKRGKRFAAKSRSIRKRLGYKDKT